MNGSTANSTSTIAQDCAFFVAILATAVALGAALAHAMELPNKICLSREAYFIVQRIYDGWNRIAYVLGVELIGIIAVIVLYRDKATVRRPAVMALGALIAAQAIFWIWTFPANAATANWTEQPGNWEALRAQWEYSHLAGAVFQLIVMGCLTVAVLRRPHAAN